MMPIHSILVLVALPCLPAAPDQLVLQTSAEGDERLPVPVPLARKEAEKLVRQLFKDEYAKALSENK